MGVEWNAQETEGLRHLMKSGYSYSMAAEELTRQFGRHFATNAIAGKCHRLGIKVSKAPAPEQVIAARAPRHRATPRGRQTTASPRVMVRAIPIADDTEDAEEKPGDGIQPKITDILDLRLDSCRFPIGTPNRVGFGYCGNKATRGPYCKHHAEIAYSRVPKDWRFNTKA